MNPRKLKPGDRILWDNRVEEVVIDINEDVFKFVYSLGQNPAFCLWECHLCRFNQADIEYPKKNNVFVEEYDTPLQAIRAAAELVRGLE